MLGTSKGLELGGLEPHVCWDQLGTGTGDIGNFRSQGVTQSVLGTSKGLALGVLGAAGICGDPKTTTRGVLGTSKRLELGGLGKGRRENPQRDEPGRLHHPAEDFPLAPAPRGGFGRFELEQSED